MDRHTYFTYYILHVFEEEEEERRKKKEERRKKIEGLSIFTIIIIIFIKPIHPFLMVSTSMLLLHQGKQKK